MIKLIALDLDGTLTQHKSKLDIAGYNTLTQLSKKYHLVMVCAGGCQRVYEQLNGFMVDIIGFYGMERSVIQSGKLQIIEKVKIENEKTIIVKKVNYLRNALGFYKYYGDSVEFHDSGIVTFPVLGTEAPLEKKLSFDPNREIRRKCYRLVCEVFCNENVFIGGSSSFDIAPKPYRKLYALEQYMIKKNISKSEVIYFGDDYGLGGNDNDIFQSDISFIQIDDYRTFPKIAKEVLL